MSPTLHAGQSCFASPHTMYQKKEQGLTFDVVTQPRGLEAFSRKVTTTASHLMGPVVDPSSSGHYQSAMTEVQKHLRRPNLQRSMFSMARTTPSDLVRSKLSTREIQHRALAHVPDDMLANIPEDDNNSYSLFQGFQASFPELTDEGKKHRRRVSRGRKLLDEGPTTPENGTTGLQKLRKERASMSHELEMLGIRKNMASSEIREIDIKIANLHGMRRIILERLAALEQEETLLEHDRKFLVSSSRESTILSRKTSDFELPKLSNGG